MKKIYLVYIFFWVIALGILFYFSHNANSIYQFNEKREEYYTKGQIIEIKDDNFLVRLDENNEIVRTQLNEFYLQNDYKKGDKVSLYVYKPEKGGTEYDIADYYHFDGLLFIFIIFCVLAIWTAKRKGLFSIISVMLSLGFFYGIILNAVQSGFSVLTASIIYVILITVLTIPLIHGFNKKSLSSIIAVIFGYLIGFLLTYFFIFSAKIGNTPSEEFRLLFTQFPDINISHILVASLFLGVVGALIDVAVSITSAIFEGLKEQPRLTFHAVYNLGMNVGKDILGSMINTLLIAYLASSLPFLVLMTLGGFNNLHEFINYDFITLELTRIFIGAASIILLIPITSIISAYLVEKLKTPFSRIN